MNKHLLFVDDEPHVLEGILRNLSSDFEVYTAKSGAQGLEILNQKGPFAVVVSDMQMPIMNGAVFLGLVREKSPDTVRMLLTGHAEINTAITAVNEGQIFRFLTKPCPLAMLRQAVLAGMEQYRLITGERELLEKTLTGSITILTEILSMIEPHAFGRTEEIKAAIQIIAQNHPEVHSWELQMAAMLARIGQVAIPPEVIVKLNTGEVLSPAEKELLDRVPFIGQKLLKNIPRLEHVAQIVYYQDKNFDGSGSPQDIISGESIPLGARYLKVLHDLLELTSRGMTKVTSLQTMRKRRGWYDPKVLDLIEQYLVAPPVKESNAASFSAPPAVLFFAHTKYKKTATVTANPTKDDSLPPDPDPLNFTAIPLKELRVGHILAANLESKNSVVLLTAGKVITELQLERIQNVVAISGIKEPIKIFKAPSSPIYAKKV